MKKLIVAVFFSVSAVSAHAGSITFEAPQNSTIEVEPNIGIGGSWIIPAVIVAILALAITATTDPQNL